MNIKIYNMEDLQKQKDKVKGHKFHQPVITDKKTLELRFLELEINIAYLQSINEGYFIPGSGV